MRLRRQLISSNLQPAIPSRCCVRLRRGTCVLHRYFLCVRVKHFDQLAQGFRARFAHYGCAMTFDRPNRDI
jgi:hypothetical protein